LVQKTGNDELNVKDLDGFSVELINAVLRVEDYISDISAHFEGVLGSDAAKVVSSGGKRLRPVLLIISFLGGDGDVQFCFPACAAVEFFHSATLVHDDIIDGSVERRGKKTFNYIKGDRYALLVGDYLFASCFKELASYGDSSLIRILSTVGIYSCLGEYSQHKQTRTMMRTEDYFSRIKNKTGYLFSAACHMGARLAKKSEFEIEKYSSFGMKMGQAYQIYDDSLDIVGEEEVLGKTPGSDIREGVVTLPVLMALEILAGDRRSAGVIKHAVTGKNVSKSDLDASIEILRSSGAVERAINYADDLAKEAVNDLKQVANTSQVNDAVALWLLIRQRIKTSNG
jgi:geranylgeranyl pyrophosphate synthase